MFTQEYLCQFDRVRNHARVVRVQFEIVPVVAFRILDDLLEDRLADGDELALPAVDIGLWDLSYLLFIEVEWFEERGVLRQPVRFRGDTERFEHPVERHTVYGDRTIDIYQVFDAFRHPVRNPCNNQRGVTVTHQNNAVQVLIIYEFAYLGDMLAESGILGLGQGGRIDSVAVFFEQGNYLVP